MSGSRTHHLLKRSLLGYIVAAALSSGLAPAQYGVHPDGEKLRELAPSGTHAVALFFVASDCPISDRTFPEMKRLRESFTSRGVRVLFVYPNSTERPAEVAAHQRAFDPGGEFLFDPIGELVGLTHVRVTPEASVLLPQGKGWRVVYTGRIDDRFVHLGVERPRPTRFFADEALTAALAGKPGPTATGTPVGCAIVNSASTLDKSGGRR